MKCQYGDMSFSHTFQIPWSILKSNDFIEMTNIYGQEHCVGEYFSNFRFK